MSEKNNTYNLSQNANLIEMDAGIYENIPFLDYIRINAISHSELKRFKQQSPLHYKYKVDNEVKEEKEAFSDGRIYHLAILEPENFEKNVIHEPKDWKKYKMMLPEDEVKKLEKDPSRMFDGRTRANKIIMPAFYNQVEEKRKENEGFIVCSWEVYKNALKMRESIMNNPVAEKLFHNGRTEVTLVWHDRETGLKCKGRLDIDNEDKHYFADLKKTKSARPYDFAYDFKKYGYYSQFAFYKDGAEELGHKEIKAAICLAVEDFAPFYNHTFYVKSDSSWFEKGREWYVKAIEELHYCITTDEWHGYYDKKNDSFKMYELPNLFDYQD